MVFLYIALIQSKNRIPLFKEIKFLLIVGMASNDLQYKKYKYILNINYFNKRDINHIIIIMENKKI